MLRRQFLWHGSLAVMAVGVIATPVQANFHLMQIEQVIGGVNGDATAQAIQLRMRAPGENIVSSSRIRAWDATGSNPVLIINIAQNVANFQAGDRVLVVSVPFDQATDPPVVADFFMTNPIPQSYLAAGSLSFEEDNGRIYWRLSWGGAAYTGSTMGVSQNVTGSGTGPADFGPPFAGALPSTTLQALRFTGTASALSTTNAADYAVTTGAATFTNNARNSFTVIVPSVVGDIDGDSDVDATDFARCVTCLAGPGGVIPDPCTSEDFAACDLHEDSGVDLLDVAELALIVSAP